MGLFTDLFSTKPAQQAATDAKAGYAAGETNASTELTKGQTGADALYGKAYAPFASLIDSTGKGAGTYADAVGVNGADGIARAGSTFKALPGYSGGLTTGIDQVMRTNARAGNLGGGNNTADEIRFASDYDNQKYGNYVSSLAPYLGANQSAISGGAGVLGTQAAADLGVAGKKADNIYNASVGAGNAQAQADLAPYNASQNFWSALMGLGNMGAKAFGGKGGSAAAGGSGSAASVAGGSADLGAGTGDLAYLAFA